MISSDFFNQQEWRNYLMPLFLLNMLVWTLYYKRFADPIMDRLLPKKNRETLREKKMKDPDLARMCRVNGTAFAHACFTSMFSVITMLRLKDDIFYANSRLFDYSSLVMGGYFFWDVLICLIHFDLFGMSYLLHALLGLSATYFQMRSTEMRTTWLAAALASTEISTPCLQLRYFLLKSGNRGWYFQCVNAAFLLTFGIYRLVWIPWRALIPYTKFMFENPDQPLRLYFQLLVGHSWLAINLYWAGLLLCSQRKAVSRMFSKDVVKAD